MKNTILQDDSQVARNILNGVSVCLPVEIARLGGFLFLLLASTVCADNKIIVKGYTSGRICEAIRKAEGVHSIYPYGIKSVSCSTQDECKRVCIKTIRHYRKDFAKLENQGTEDFIEYSSRRYVAGDTRANQKSWVKNVKFFLTKEAL